MKQRTNIEKLHQNSRNMKANLQQSPFEERKMECDTAECNLSGSGGRTLSVVVLLIYELGHSGQLHIRRTLVNGTCTRRQNKALERIPALQNKVNFVESPPDMNLGRQEGSLFSLPENPNVGGERKSDILPWQLPWLRVGIMALWWGGIPAESDYSLCYQPPPTHSLRPALVQSRNNYTWPSLSPRDLCPFHGNNLTSSVQNTGCPVMPTNFTVSVVFLYGVVLGEADSSHPFDAFGRG